MTVFITDGAERTSLAIARSLGKKGLLAGDGAVRKMKLFYCAKCKSQNPKLQYQNEGILDSEIRLINNKVENIFEQ